jgi:hypothetical protein
MFVYMKTASHYRYLILLNGKQVGPFDRRTVVGMRMKKLLDNNTALLRSDGLPMTVAELTMDRHEVATATTQEDSAHNPLSGVWPSFQVDFGGGWTRAGALGFTGPGELRFQGDALRLTGQRNGVFFGSKQVRITLPIDGVAWTRPSNKDASILEVMLKPSQLFRNIKRLPLEIKLEDMDAVRELLELISMDIQPASKI